jgi:hypothetical protein
MRAIDHDDGQDYNQFVGYVRSANCYPDTGRIEDKKLIAFLMRKWNDTYRKIGTPIL